MTKIQRQIKKCSTENINDYQLQDVKKLIETFYAVFFSRFFFLFFKLEIKNFTIKVIKEKEINKRLLLLINAFLIKVILISAR